MEVKNLVNVVNTIIPLYVAILLGYLSVKPWNIFNQEQTKALNTLNTVFVIPAFSFQFLAKTKLYEMDFIFVLADTVTKIGMLVGLGFWVRYLTAIPTMSGHWEWWIVSFMVASVANTLIIGIPLLEAMYGSESATLLAQVVVVQLVLWFPLLQILLELCTAIRRAEVLHGFDDSSRAGTKPSWGVVDTTSSKDTQEKVDDGTWGEEREYVSQTSGKGEGIVAKNTDTASSYVRIGGEVRVSVGEEKDREEAEAMMTRIKARSTAWVRKLNRALHHRFSGRKWRSRDSHTKNTPTVDNSRAQAVGGTVGLGGGPSSGGGDGGATVPLRFLKRVDLGGMIMAPCHPGTSDASVLSAHSSGLERRQGSGAVGPRLGEGDTLGIQSGGPLPSVGESVVNVGSPASFQSVEPATGLGGILSAQPVVGLLHAELQSAAAPTLLPLAGTMSTSVPPCDQQDHLSAHRSKSIQLATPSAKVLGGSTSKQVEAPLNHIYSAAAATTTPMPTPTLMPSLTEAKDTVRADHVRSCGPQEACHKLTIRSGKPGKGDNAAERGQGEETLGLSTEEKREFSTRGEGEGGSVQKIQKRIPQKEGMQPLSSGSGSQFRSRSTSTSFSGGEGELRREHEEDAMKAANRLHLVHHVSLPSLPISFLPGVRERNECDQPTKQQCPSGLATVYEYPQFAEGEEGKEDHSQQCQLHQHLHNKQQDGLVVSSSHKATECLTPAPRPVSGSGPGPGHFPLSVGPIQIIPINGKGKSTRSVKMSSAEIKQALKVSAKSFLYSQLVWASILGLIYSLVAQRFGFGMPLILSKSLTLMANLCLGLSMFSLGLFMAFQPKLIPISAWTTTWTFSLRLFWAPLVVTVVTYLFGCRGLLLKVAFIQNALPQAVVSFVLANQFQTHANVLSTGVCFGTLVSLPLLIVYYMVLEKVL